MADRIALLDRACLDIGRDPAEIRRSTWASGEVLASTAAYVDFVERHRALGFTDFTTVLPAPGNERILEEVAREVIPRIRTEAVVARRA